MSEVCKFIAENSDFELLLSPDGQVVSTRKDSGFEFLFKSAKANFGIKKGKYMFEMKVREFINTDSYYGPGHIAKEEFSQRMFSEQNSRHVVRVGFTCAPYQKLLGSDLNSCGYDNSGNKHYGGYRKTFSEGFGENDVIRCCIELGGTNNVISYYKNGKSLGPCYEIPANRRDKAWFPMVCLRNACVEFNFGGGVSPQEFCPIIDEEEAPANKTENGAEGAQPAEGQQQQQQPEVQQPGQLPTIPQPQDGSVLKNFKIDIGEYKFVNYTTDDERDYHNVKENEGSPKLILMVGLPSSGKTTFAEQYVSKYPNTMILSTQIIFQHITEQLRIQALNQKVILLMEICDEIFIKLMKISSYTKKDIIIDQCNVLLRSRLEKLAYFRDHQNEAVVLITSNIELEKRQLKKDRKQERCIPKMGADALRTLKENFVIPTEQEGFYRVHFVELEEDLSRKVVLLGKEISDLGIHPLFRKKNFAKIDEFKKEHGLTKNYMDFRKLNEEKRQEEQRKLEEEQKQIEEKIQEENKATQGVDANGQASTTAVPSIDNNGTATAATTQNGDSLLGKRTNPNPQEQTITAPPQPSIQQQYNAQPGAGRGQPIPAKKITQQRPPQPRQPYNQYNNRGRGQYGGYPYQQGYEYQQYDQQQQQYGYGQYDQQQAYQNQQYGYQNQQYQQYNPQQQQHYGYQQQNYYDQYRR